MPAAGQSPDELFTPSNRIELKDKLVSADAEALDLSNRLFKRLGAKNRRFTKIDFRYSIFDGCYLRDCAFDSCDFTGCRFISTHLPGSSFTGCKFDYATFERTTINSDVLDSGCPGTENLAEKFARSLRINYQQLGDSESVNRAISVELDATKTHLLKAWRSKESYYRGKYRGAIRFQMFLKWLWFRTSDFVWGNGESIPKFARSILLIVATMVPFDIAWDKTKSFILVPSYGRSLFDSFEVFLGIRTPTFYPPLFLSFVVLCRIVSCGLLISLIVKRTNRR